jgi:hypothetical protein
MKRYNILIFNELNSVELLISLDKLTPLPALSKGKGAIPA